MRSGARHFIELLYAMTEKELRARYKHTVFGFFWLVANPLLQMLVIGFVFRFFMREPIAHYDLYLFVGLLAWNFFSLSFTKATPSIVFERSLIKKAAFPKEVIPLSIILSNLVHFIAALLLALLPAGIQGTLSFGGLVSVMAGIVILFAFTSGASLVASALNVRFRDVNFFVQAILVIWFYATPIIYTASFIPAQYLPLWRLNPMTSVVQLMQHGLAGAPAPSTDVLAANILIIAVVAAIGIFVFRRESRYFDDWV